MDVAPMERCPVRKSGRHELSALIPSDDDLDLTLFCNLCGAMRRVPATGSLPLDMASAETIARLVGDGSP